MRKGFVSVTIIGSLLVAILTSCASEQPAVSQTPGDDGMVSVQAEVETNLDRNDFAFVCPTTFQVEQDPATGEYAIQEIQTKGFITSKGKPIYAFLPKEDAETTRQEDGSCLVQQSLQMYKNNEESATLSLAAKFTLNAETGEITSTVLPVEVQDTN
ncbi:hypothetical protein [Evtepia sp.]|uniref:hypothetical protein n=1 Tax=Evtepia sp. TaxID=2773933 RepID=UPI003F16B969